MSSWSFLDNYPDTQIHYWIFLMSWIHTVFLNQCKWLCWDFWFFLFYFYWGRVCACARVYVFFRIFHISFLSKYLLFLFPAWLPWLDSPVWYWIEVEWTLLLFMLWWWGKASVFHHEVWCSWWVVIDTPIRWGSSLYS